MSFFGTPLMFMVDATISAEKTFLEPLFHNEQLISTTISM
jgi:hypothetical protein